MFSSKLNQSLHEIILIRQKKARRQRFTRRPGPTATAPAGGVKKPVKPARNAGKPTLTKGAGLVGESKVVVNNLVCLRQKYPDRIRNSLLTLYSRRTFPKAILRYVTDDAVLTSMISIRRLHDVRGCRSPY
jgi:hypothetical protein